MSDSKKKAFSTCSKPRTEVHRRRERHAIRQILHVDPFSDEVFMDPKELGGDEWGTKLGLEFNENEEWQEDRKKGRRK